MSRYTPLWLQQGSYAASVDRRLIAALWPTPASSGGAATVSGGTMSVSVAAGSAAVPSQNGTGATLCVWDAPELVTHSAAPGSPNSRIDIITVHPRGNDLDNGSNNDFIIDIVVGTPATSPAAPAVPAGQVGIWQVMVPTGAAALVQGNLTDIRPGGLAIPTSGAGSPPRGWLVSTTGPSTAINVGTSNTTLMSVTFPVTAGRRYRLTTTVNGIQATAVGTSRFFWGAVNLTLDGPIYMAYATGLPIGSVLLGSGSTGAVATATGTGTANIAAVTSAGTLNVAANNCSVMAEDMGST